MKINTVGDLIAELSKFAPGTVIDVVDRNGGSAEITNIRFFTDVRYRSTFDSVNLCIDSNFNSE